MASTTQTAPPAEHEWQQLYRQRLTTSAEAVKAVKPGDTVVFSIFPPLTLPPALFARRDDLRDVTIRLLAPASDPGWLRMSDESTFNVAFELYIGDFARFVTDERRGSYLPNLFSLGMKAYDDERRTDVHTPDVIFCSVSPPNRAGFCHFGVHNWVQRSYARRCPTVIAEVNPNLQQVFGDVYIHVSEIDHFVEFNPPPFGRADFDRAVETVPDPARREGWRTLADELPDVRLLGAIAGVLAAVSPDDARRLLGLAEPPPEAGPIAKHLHELIYDGDTIQIGTGEPSRGMARLGAFDGRKHLGIHTELGWPGLARMWRDGIVDGSRKELHTDRSVAAAWTGCDPNDLDIIDGNPHFELYDPEYVLHPRTLTKFDTFVAINNAISVDLLGQITAESVFGGTHDQRHGRPARDAPRRRLRAARTRCHAAAFDRDGRGGIPHRPAARDRHACHRAALLRRLRHNRVRRRTAMGQEPPRARGRADCRRAP